MTTTRRTVRFLALTAFVTLAGCASANRIQRSSEYHAERSHQLAIEGNYHAASKEQQSAEKLASKANTRRGFEDVMPIVFF
jgi:outer membrane murein-binding lipoprotein Lpp